MREEHMAAVYGALEANAQAQEAISSLTLLLEGNRGIMGAAVGKAQTESAQNVRAFSDAVLVQLEQVYATTAQITAELERYAGGF